MKDKTLCAALCLNLLMAGAAFAVDESREFDFNTASAAEMVEICKTRNIDLDPVVAANIVAYREANGPIKTEDDLLKVDGVTLRLIIQLIPIAYKGSLWFPDLSYYSRGNFYHGDR